MDFSKLVSAAVIASGAFYLGYRYARGVDHKRRTLAWQHNFQTLNEDLTELKESFKGSAADVQKRVKARYEAILAKIGRELHRSDVLELLRAEINEVRELLAGK